MAFKFQAFKFLILNRAPKLFLERHFHHLITKFLPSSLNLFDTKNVEVFERNIKMRKTSGNLQLIKGLLDKIQNANEKEKGLLLLQLENELWKLPNQTHPNCLTYGDEPKELARFNEMPFNKLEFKEFSEIAKKLNILRMEHLGNFTGHKSYYFMDSLAEMEHALIRYTINHLEKEQFKIISVPDILPSDIIEGCGMQTSGERTQVYKLKSSGKCLSGTSEMALAGYFQNKILQEEELPIKLTATSRCFRAETSGLQEEKGVYRVHQFTKVEMFSVCTEFQSEQMLESFKDIEIDLYKKLGIHFKLLDMPPCELGAPAFRKYDIEAWMPGRKMWGEISSCSNCTDYQAKRLGIRYKKKDGTLEYVHTVNGTACAIPRLLITLLETYQHNEDKVIKIPEVLRGYLNNKAAISKQNKIPDLKLVKHIESSGLS